MRHPEESRFRVAADLVPAVRTHRETGEHPLAHVLGDVAMQQPRTRIVRERVGDLHAGGAGVPRHRCCDAFRHRAQAMPVRAVEIASDPMPNRYQRTCSPSFMSSPPRLPKTRPLIECRWPSSAACCASAQVGVGWSAGALAGGAGASSDVPDGVGAGLVVDREKRGHLAVHVARRAVRPRARRIGDDEEADQAEVDLLVAGGVAVVEPRLGTRFVRPRAAGFVELPDVGKFRAGCHRRPESPTGL